MTWFSAVQLVYREGGPTAVCVAVLDRIRQAFSRDFRPMAHYSEDARTHWRPSDDEFTKILQQHEGNTITKWAHYPEIYDRHLARFRNTAVRFLEIGVFRGGSLDVWRKYFGPKAQITGIDINPECAQFQGASGAVRIGSQADAAFLNAVIDEMGGIDVILDDGSHNSRHIRKTLEVLFPRLSENGIYMVEDLHCAYLPRFGGGYRWRWSFMTDIKSIVDDLHHWYHRRGQRNAVLADNLYAMHIYDSIVVFDKRRIPPPISFERPARPNPPSDDKSA